MCMYDERLQILINAEQRRRWETEARRRGISVAALIREAVDQHLGSTDRNRRRKALAAIKKMSTPFMTVEEMDRIIEETRSAERGW